MSILEKKAKSLLSTGEPDAGNPPVRFGGRGAAIQRGFPTPIFDFCRLCPSGVPTVPAFQVYLTLRIALRRQTFVRVSLPLNLRFRPCGCFCNNERWTVEMLLDHW